MLFRKIISFDIVNMFPSVSEYNQNDKRVCDAFKNQNKIEDMKNSLRIYHIIKLLCYSTNIVMGLD